MPASRLAAWVTQLSDREVRHKCESGLCQFLRSLAGMPARVGESEANY